MRRMAAVLLAIVLNALMLFGQRVGTMMRDEPGGPAPFLFFEAVNLAPDSASLSRVDINYRIDENFFVAVKSRDASSPWAFMSRGEILIELIDSLDVSKARTVQRVEFGTDRSERDEPGKKWYRNIASFEVPPGPYKVIFEIDDLESERRHIDDKAIVRLKTFDSQSHGTSSPLFIDWSKTQTLPGELTSIGFGPNLLFGKKAALLIEIPSPFAEKEEVHVEYTISITSRNDRTTIALAETLANVPALPRIRLNRGMKGDTPFYDVTSDNASRALGIIVPLASEKLPLRRFDLAMTIHIGKNEFKVSKNFQMVWPEMPFSLRDIDYAITVLKYITTDDQRDSLRKGDLEQRRDNLETFWKRRDNTPATAYNEVMVEYYQRVDHASKTFGTLRDPDGFKSDRGRTYILYGPPTKTERTLSPSAGYQEMWAYENLGKKFIFVDQGKSGNYVLVSTQPL